nr:hypothetical protein [Tanacetum cinerariifolium]
MVKTGLFKAIDSLIPLDEHLATFLGVLGLESSLVLIIAVDWEYLSLTAATWIERFDSWDLGTGSHGVLGEVHGTVQVDAGVRERVYGGDGKKAGKLVTGS